MPDTFEMKDHDEINCHDTGNRWKLIMFNGDVLYDYGSSKIVVMQKVKEYRRLQKKEDRISHVERA